MVDSGKMKSREELYFLSWLLELTHYGFIESFSYESTTLHLSHSVQVTFNKQLKTKVKVETKTIKKGVEYTPDFEIIWNLDKSDGVLTYNSNNSYEELPLFWLPEGCRRSYIEIKGNFDKLGTGRDTRTKMAWAMSKYNIHIDLVKPLKLFELTFYPELYLLTDSFKGDRKKKVNGKFVPLRDITRNIKQWNDGNN